MTLLLQIRTGLLLYYLKFAMQCLEVVCFKKGRLYLVHLQSI